MESYEELCESFLAINERKRWTPESMSGGDWEQWKSRCRALEMVLFRGFPAPVPVERRSLRLPVAMEVRCYVKDEVRERYLKMISDGGAFVASVDPLPVQTRLNLELLAQHGEEAARLEGEVVWVKHSEDPAQRGMGIKYVDLTDEQKQRVYQLVDESLMRHLMGLRASLAEAIDTRLVFEFVYAEGQLASGPQAADSTELFIATPHLLDPGDRLRLVLYVPGQSPAVTARGEVIGVVATPLSGQQQGFRVRLVQISQEGADTLQRYLGTRPSESGDGVEDSQIAHQLEQMKLRIRLRFAGERAAGIVYNDDLRCKGAFFPTQTRLTKGAPVRISLVHPVHLRALELHGEVVESQAEEAALAQARPGVRVIFKDLDEDARGRLQKYLRDFATQETR